MASRKQPAAGQDTNDERADAAPVSESTSTAGGDGSAERPDTKPASPIGEPTASGGGAEGAAADAAAAPPDPAPPAAPPQTVTAPADITTSSDPVAGIRAVAGARAREERSRRFREIPAEGVAIDAEDMDLLAVHLDLEPGTLLAARQYRDRLVCVTRDGRKIAKGMR